VAIADRPVPPLSFGGGFDALTDTVTASGLCLQLVDVGCHDLLADGVVGSGVVDEESAVVLFDHVPIISMGWGRSRPHIVHFVCWHTGDGVTADLLRVLSPLINRLVHNTIVLPIHALGGLALTFSPEKDDRMLGRFVEVDLNLIERIVAFG